MIKWQQTGGAHDFTLMLRKMTICLSSNKTRAVYQSINNIAIQLFLIIPVRQYIFLLLIARRGDIVLFEDCGQFTRGKILIKV